MKSSTLFLSACASLASLNVVAQSFPAKPIRIIVGFPAGGPSDFIARTTGQEVSKIVSQQVLVDNRGGASGMIAAELAAKSPADGYTTHLIGVGAYVVNPALFRKIHYSPSDFAMVTLAVKVPEALVVHPSLPVKTTKELIALAKKRPGELNYCSAGAGGVPHLAGELFRHAAGINITHVPYKGAAPAVADMVGGHTQMGFWDTPILVPHVQSGKLRALMIATANRFAAWPTVPTSAQAGMPDVIVDNWYAIAVPAATPKNIVARLQGVFAKALQSPAVRDRFAPMGVVAVGSTTEEMAAFVKAETEKWVGVAKRANIRLD